MEQHQFDWMAATTTAVHATSLEPEQLPPAPVVLRWDFRETFPTPLPEAIEAGVLDGCDTAPDAVHSIHEEHAAECLSILRDMDAIAAARQVGIDPHTGRKPRTEATRQRLQQLFVTAPLALASDFEDLISVYESAFGDEAADAFRNALNAWHRGIPVKSEPAHDLAL